MKNTTITSNGSTMQWKLKLIKLSQKLRSDCKPSDALPQRGVHLAIFSEPFLTFLLSGKKTIESRFSINRNGPYKKVFKDDLVFIKKSGGPVFGYFIVGKTSFYNSPSSTQIKTIKKKYEKEICSMEVKDFWKERSKAKFITLMEVAEIKDIAPINIEKKDRTAWVIIKPSHKLQFSDFD